MERFLLTPSKTIITKDSLLNGEPFKRYIPRRKREIVLAVEGGVITLSEAIDKYQLSIEEYLEWSRKVDRSKIYTVHNETEVYAGD